MPRRLSGKDAQPEPPLCRPALLGGEDDALVDGAAFQDWPGVFAAGDVRYGSVKRCAATEDGSLLIASASGSQLGPLVSGAGHAVFVIGAQDCQRRHNRDAAHLWILLPAQDARARRAFGVPTGSTTSSSSMQRDHPPTGSPRSSSASASAFDHLDVPVPPEGWVSRRASPVVILHG